MIAPVPLSSDTPQPPTVTPAGETAALYAVARLAAGGLPLASGLDAYSREIGSRRARRWLRRLSHALQSGVPLDEAIVDTARWLPVYLDGLLQAALASGRLAPVLEQHLLSLRRAREVRFRFWMSMAYPLVLVAVALAVLVLMLAWFVPVMQQIFSDFGVPLPELTVWTISASNGIRRLLPYWPYVLLLIAAVAGGVWSIRFIPGRAARVRLWQRCPVVGTASASVGLSEFCGLLALLVECHVPLPRALRLTASASRDPNLAEGGRRLAERCEAGSTPAQAIAALPHFPPALESVFRWDGRPDALVRGLRAAAELYAMQARVHAWLASALIQPLAFLLVVVVIGGVLASLFLPLIALLRSLI